MTKKMSYQERGRIGGLKTKKIYGSEHFKEAGRLGGLKISADRDYMAELGRKGGKALQSKNRE